MIGSLAALIGGGVLSFLCFYVAFNINRQSEGRETQFTQQFLQLLMIVFGLLFLLVVTKANLDLTNYCPVVANESLTMGNTTSFTYDRVCFDNPNNTNEQLYVTSYWLVGGGLLLLVFHIVWSLFKWGQAKMLDRKERNGR